MAVFIVKDLGLALAVKIFSRPTYLFICLLVRLLSRLLSWHFFFLFLSATGLP